MRIPASNHYLVLNRQLSRMASSSSRLAPREWLLQLASPSPMELRGQPLPPKRIEYALDPNIQRYTVHALKWLEKDLAKRRRDRIVSNSNCPISSNIESFADHCEEYIVKPLDALFDLLRAPFYDKVDFELSECKVEDKTAVKMTMQSRPVNWKSDLTIFIFPFLNLESPPVIDISHRTKDTLLVDYFGAVFLGQDAKNGCERTCIISLNLPLHYFLASFVKMSLPEDFLNTDIEKVVPTHGALNNPNIPILTDDEILNRCHSHEDFDRYELSQDLDAIRRFLRWKTAMRSASPPTMEGLEARVIGRPKRFAPFYPRYELEALPTSTMKHVEESRRQTSSALSDYLAKNLNSNITLSLDSEISPSEGMGYARTFSCSLTASSPIPEGMSIPEKLVVKLFDDRSGIVPQPDLAGNNPLWWSQNFMTAHDMLTNELNTYLRLRRVWGSTVPWFYGTFLFELPGGRQLPGILLEYVEADLVAIKDQPEETQIKIIQSARDAIRVLQLSDVTQKDWSKRQVIIAKPTSPNSHPYCVLIDFSLASQGDRWHDVDRQDDYGEMADLLMINEYDPESDGVSLDLLLNHYDPREIWDLWATSQAMDREKPWGPPGY